MGYMLHHAIVVTSWDATRMREASTEAGRLGLHTIGPDGPPLNGYQHLLVCPDGSKDGWGESAAGDERRHLFVNWLRAQAHFDGSSSFEWFECAYGGDGRSAAIAQSQWVAPREQQAEEHKT